MFRIPLKSRLFVAVVAGFAILVSGTGCAGSGSTRVMPIDSVREVFPSTAELIEMPVDGEVKSPGRSGGSVVREIRGPSKLLGYLVESQVTGRSGPFNIAVLLDEQLVVKRAMVLSYPWSRGRDVGRRSFGRQFEGKGPEDVIEIGKDIDAVTGATISCKAMAQGVREAVGLLAE